MTAPVVMSDEELFQLTGSWEAAAEMRDDQYRALNEYNNSLPAVAEPVAATVAAPAAVAEPAAAEEPAAPVTYTSYETESGTVYEPVYTPPATTLATVETPTAPTGGLPTTPIVTTPTVTEPITTGGLSVLEPSSSVATPSNTTTTPTSGLSTVADTTTQQTSNTVADQTTVGGLPTVNNTNNVSTISAPVTSPTKPSDADIVKLLTDNSTAEDTKLVKLLEDIGATPADIARATGSKVADVEKRYNDVAVKNWPTIIPGSTDEDGRPLTVTTTSDGTPFYLRDEDGGGMYQNPATVETYKPVVGADGKTYYAIHAPTFSSGKEPTETPITGYMTEAQFKAFQGGSTLGDAVKSVVDSPVGSFALGVMGPYGQAINAVNQASKGNILGATVSGLSAAGGFGVSDIGGLDIKTATNVARTLNAIDKNDLIGAVTAGSSLFGGVPSEYKTAANLASAGFALKNNDTAGFVTALGDLTGNQDVKIAAAATKLLTAISSDTLSATALQSAVNNFNSAIKGSTTTKTTSDATTLPSGLQLAGVTDGTTSDAGSGLTLGGVDAKTQATLDALKDVDKIGTGATTAPSWVVLANDENITGTKFQSDGSQVYTIERVNPNNPDEKVYYDVVKDPETGEVYYKQGGISFDEEGNVSPFGYETISGSKPSWTWKAKDEATAGTEGDKSSDTTSGLSNIDTSDTTKGASGALSTVKSNVTGADANTVATSTVGGAGGDASKTPVVGGLGGDSGTTGTKGTTGTGGTGTLDAVTGGGGGAGSGGDGTGGGTGTNSTTINNGDGTNTTVVVAPTGTVTTHECKDGFHWDETAKACVANVVTPPVVTPPVVTPPVVTPPVVTPPVVTPPVTPPVVKEPVVTSPLSSAGIASPKLDSSPQFLAGASPQKRMELAKLQQLFASLTPELAAVFSERGFQPPKYKEEKEEEAKEDSKEDKSVFGNLTDGMYNPQSKFMATGGSVLDSMKPKYVESAKYLSAAPVHGTGGVDGPLKLAILKHLKQSISAPPRSMDGLAQGGLPSKYAKAAPKGHKPEFITGLTGYYAQGEGTGQSDDIPAMLHDGDYVIDADAVAALGDGSSKAGAQVLSQFQSKVPHKMSAGGEAVPAKIADGEYVFPEAFVTAIGGGDNKQGSKLLDAMREELRAHKRSAPTSKIPPKAKSPLDYLRMAKG